MNTIEEMIAAAEEIHRLLGPGHSEATYHRAMERELSERGIGFSSEGTIPIFYKGQPVGKRRPDMFVDAENGTIVVELKAGSSSGKAQLFNYQHILCDDNNYDIANGLLIRFNDEVEIIRS
jgi:hypothetical protein